MQHMTDVEIAQQTLSIVRAQAGVRVLQAEEIITMTRTIHRGLLDVLGRSEDAQAIPVHLAEPAMSPAQAIKERSVTCLECGQKFKIITRKHLSSHGLTPKEYRAKHGYKPGTKLVAKGLARDRREKMGELKLWEKRGAAANG